MMLCRSSGRARQSRYCFSEPKHYSLRLSLLSRERAGISLSQPCGPFTCLKARSAMNAMSATSDMSAMSSISSMNTTYDILVLSPPVAVDVLPGLERLKTLDMTCRKTIHTRLDIPLLMLPLRNIALCAVSYNLTPYASGHIQCPNQS